MGKYSDVDIDEMLKRIQENVDKQSSNAESKAEYVPLKREKSSADSSPDELLDRVIADIEKRGIKSKPSTEVSQYDISGFEIEEIVDEPSDEEIKEDVTHINADASDADDLSGEDITEDSDTSAIDEEATEASEPADEPIEVEACVDLSEEIYDNEGEEITEELDECADVHIGDEEAAVLEDEADIADVISAPTEVFDELSIQSDAEDIDSEEEKEEADEVIAEVAESAESAENDELVLEPLPYPEISEPALDLCNADIDATEPEEDKITEVQEENTEESFIESENVDFAKMPKVTSAFSMNSAYSSVSAHGEKTADGSDSNHYDILDYSDMNLAMAMGSKDSLETAYGYVRVSEAKHNFASADRKGSGTNVILDTKGREYRNFDQNSEIHDAYRREKKRIGRRVIVTAILFVLIALCEMMYPTGAISDVSEFMSLQFRYNVLSIFLFTIAVSMSAKKLFVGFIGFFTTRLNYYTVIGFVSAINIVYDVLVISVFKDMDMLMFNSVATLELLVIIIGEYMQLKREINTFELASNGDKKISLEKIEITSETTKKESFASSNEFVLENTSFVGRYFERSARTPDMYNIRHTFVMLTLLLTMFVAVTSVIITREFSDFVFVVELSSLLCVPVQMVFFGSYAFYIISKKLLKLDSAIIGETLTDEYVGSNTIYLDDVEVFGKRGVHIVNLESFNNFNIIDINYYYLSVFSKISGPLKNAFGDIPENMKLSENVELVNVFSNGIEAKVDEKNKILVGKGTFLASRGISIEKNTDERHSDKGDVSVMYLAVNGALCAKLYLKYSLTHHFEKFAIDMVENGSSVGVRTIDPNVTEEMLSSMRGDSENSIKVIRPTLNNLLPIERRSDSGIITEKNPHMIARILAEGLKVKRVNSIVNILWGVYSIVGIIAVITFMLLGIFNRILPLFIILYKTVWFVGQIIFVKNKLRNGKTR